MAYSLLAHLATHIRGSQEDIATYSLHYLLLQSDALNRAFTKKVSEILQLDLKDKLNYSCQVTGKGDEKERPDMSGIDSTGKEIILCEMKFYATLTANQPLTYIDRLKKNEGKGLLFICPSARKTNLWAKLIELCINRNVDIINENCVKVDGIHLSIISWEEILDLFKQISSTAAISCSADIVQLEGYCHQLDSEAFIPFSSEDLSAEMAIKADRYYQVIDEVIELFCADKTHNTTKKGVKATGYRKGYTRSLFIDGLTFTLNYDRDLWKNPSCIETPFWIAIRDGQWHQTESMIRKHDAFPDNKKQRFWNLIFLALEPLQNAIFSEVCEDIKRQIECYIDEIK